MKKIKLKFWFEYGCGSIWGADEYTNDRLGYYIPVEALPISEKLKNEIIEMETYFQTSLDWNNPGGESKWTENEWNSFYIRGNEIYKQLCRELGNDYEIINDIYYDDKNEWFCPAVEKIIDHGLCWEYCSVNNGGPIDTALKLKEWINNTKKFSSVKEFQKVCETCRHFQWT